jgi:uncharacterized protein YhaN
VLVLAATVALAVTGQAAAAAALAVLTALGLGICTALLLRARLGRRSPGGALGLTMEAAQREEQEQESLRRDIRELKTRMEIPAEILGVFRLGDPQEMERIDASLAEDASRAARATEQSAAFAKASERAAELLLDESSAEGRLERAQDEQRALECEFRARMVTGGLPASLSHEGVEEYLRGIAGAKELVARRDNESLQVSRMEEEVAGWEGESAGLVAAARALGVTGDSDPSGGQAGPAVEVALLALAARCRAEIVLQQQVVDLGNDKRELEVEIEVARVEAAAGAEEWAGLLAQAGAGDEEDFLGRLAVYERRQELRQNIAVGEDLVIKSVGKGPEADGLRGILGRGEISLWEERLQEAKAGIEEVRLQRAEALKLEGDIERRLRDLEEAADVPSLEIVIEGLRAALETALEQWRVHHLAGVLVRDTLTQFTQERQPLVLAEASRMFERVTEGRYVRVQRAVDDEGLVVVQADGRVKSPEELSRGAAEQLYLCVRLGLAEEFARRAEPMPLVMDDVLVNFDAARRWATAELLVEFSERHQILLFTCHEEIAQLFGRLKPGIATLELS